MTAEESQSGSGGFNMNRDTGGEAPGDSGSPPNSPQDEPVSQPPEEATLRYQASLDERADPVPDHDYWPPHIAVVRPDTGSDELLMRLSDHMIEEVLSMGPGRTGFYIDRYVEDDEVFYAEIINDFEGSNVDRVVRLGLYREMSLPESMFDEHELDVPTSSITQADPYLIEVLPPSEIGGPDGIAALHPLGFASDVFHLDRRMETPVAESHFEAATTPSSVTWEPVQELLSTVAETFDHRTLAAFDYQSPSVEAEIVSTPLGAMRTVFTPVDDRTGGSMLTEVFASVYDVPRPVAAAATASMQTATKSVLGSGESMSTDDPVFGVDHPYDTDSVDAVLIPLTPPDTISGDDAPSPVVTLPSPLQALGVERSLAKAAHFNGPDITPDVLSRVDSKLAGALYRQDEWPVEEVNRRNKIHLGGPSERRYRTVEVRYLAGNGFNNVIEIHYPDPEALSDSVIATLQRAHALGVSQLVSTDALPTEAQAQRAQSEPILVPV